MRNCERRVEKFTKRFRVAAGVTALILWAGAGAPAPAAVMSSRPVNREPAPQTSLANDTAHRSLIQVADDLGTRLDVYVPEGASRMIIRPVSDAPDGEFGWVCAYDAQGREVLRQKETIGIVFRLEERGVLVGPLGQESDAPVELRVPAGARRIRVVSQNYDKDSNPRKDGHIFAYDASGEMIADDSGLAIDVLTP